MFDPMYLAVLIGAGLIAAAVLTSVVAYRFGTPLLLVFLALGLAAGEDGLGLPFNDVPLAYQLGSIALAIILFDSGFGTRLSSLRMAAFPAVTLATLGVVVTAALVGLAAHHVFGMPWLQALLIGAIISSTDAAAVFFLLRVGGIDIHERVRSTLEVESGSNDPMAILLTTALIELITAGLTEVNLTTYLLTAFVQQMVVGLCLGALGGLLIAATVNRLQLESGLYPVVVLSAALLVFAAVGLIGGSGFLAVYVAGLIAGNQRIKGSIALRRFQDGLTWLAQIVMFLVLGLLATPSQFGAIAIPAIGLALILTFVARPLAVWICLLPYRFQPNEAAFVSWVGLRGAVSILLGTLPIMGGVDDQRIFFNTAFIIVLVSLVLQGWTIRPLAKWLGLVLPPRIGPVERVELDLPGAAQHELVTYHVAADSPVGKGQRLPRWARPSLVVRDSRSLRYQDAGRLRVGDYVYMFVPPRYVQLLDRLFAGRARLDAEDTEFFGEFAVDGNKTLRELADIYDVKIEDFDPELPLREFIKRRLGGKPEVGDRVLAGKLELIVREISEDHEVTAVGLSLDPAAFRSARVPIFLNAREISSRLARWWAKRKHK